LRPIRLLILLLAIAVALVLALLRPLQGRAGRAPARRGPHHAHIARPHRRHRHHPHPRAEARREFGHRVVSYARQFLGVRYSWGGTSPRTGFDCSGLVRFVYGHFGITLPHSSFADLWRGRHVGRRYLRAGDLVFFADASHVGIYVGDGRFIHAPHAGTVVSISSMHGWYGSSYSGARRLQRG
jgi:cell wall-associated NlpC family hydrolase